MDSGPVIAQVENVIGAEETTADLTSRLFDMGAQLLKETIPGWRDGEIEAQAQDESEAMVTRLLKREDGIIDWTFPASYIARQVRAFHPWPGSFTHWNGKQLKVHKAGVLNLDASNEPGTVIETPQGIAVASGDGALLLHRVQVEGRQAADIPDFARGYRDFVGSHLGTS